jgi:hypothetical protein
MCNWKEKKNNDNKVRASSTNSINKSIVNNLDKNVSLFNLLMRK